MMETALRHCIILLSVDSPTDSISRHIIILQSLANIRECYNHTMPWSKCMEMYSSLTEELATKLVRHLPDIEESVCRITFALRKDNRFGRRSSNLKLLREVSLGLKVLLFHFNDVFVGSQKKLEPVWHISQPNDNLGDHVAAWTNSFTFEWFYSELSKAELHAGVSVIVDLPSRVAIASPTAN